MPGHSTQPGTRFWPAQALKDVARRVVAIYRCGSYGAGELGGQTTQFIAGEVH